MTRVANERAAQTIGGLPTRRERKKLSPKLRLAQIEEHLTVLTAAYLELADLVKERLPGVAITPYFGASIKRVQDGVVGTAPPRPAAG